jgi:hypothetical protein
MKYEEFIDGFADDTAPAVLAQLGPELVDATS